MLQMHVVGRQNSLFYTARRAVRESRKPVTIDARFDTVLLASENVTQFRDSHLRSVCQRRI